MLKKMYKFAFILATGKLSPEAIPGKLNIIEDTSFL